jgi:hypothetical protein
MEAYVIGLHHDKSLRMNWDELAKGSNASFISDAVNGGRPESAINIT